jgi:hypothetical protein
VLQGLYLLFLVTYSIKPHINARGQRIGLLDTWFYSPKYEEAAAILRCSALPHSWRPYSAAVRRSWGLPVLLAGSEARARLSLNSA